MQYWMKIHKTAPEQLFTGSSTLFFCISVNLFKYSTESQPKLVCTIIHNIWGLINRWPCQLQENEMLRRMSLLGLHLVCKHF